MDKGLSTWTPRDLGRRAEWSLYSDRVITLKDIILLYVSVTMKRKEYLFGFYQLNYPRTKHRQTGGNSHKVTDSINAMGR
jgi:hypothetical protein